MQCPVPSSWQSLLDDADMPWSRFMQVPWMKCLTRPWSYHYYYYSIRVIYAWLSMAICIRDIWIQALSDNNRRYSLYSRVDSTLAPCFVQICIISGTVNWAPLTFLGTGADTDQQCIFPRLHPRLLWLFSEYKNIYNRVSVLCTMYYVEGSEIQIQITIQSVRRACEGLPDCGKRGK